VATGRLVERDGRAVIGRMAADPAVRGRGHGSAVLAELERQARLRGHAEVELHAQLSARGFYERAGYTAVGAEYEEVGIGHVTMRRRLFGDVRGLHGGVPRGETRSVRPSE
jgi:predicted GNAT family N-acyltransferase